MKRNSEGVFVKHKDKVIARAQGVPQGIAKAKGYLGRSTGIHKTSVHYNQSTGMATVFGHDKDGATVASALVYRKK